MDAPTAILWLAALIVAPFAWRRRRLREALAITLSMTLLVLPRIALAVLAAGFLALLMPDELVAAWIGAEAGWRGVVVGSLVGGLIPGGPMVSFPFVVALAKAGAGWPQLVAVLTAWSVVAVNRLIVWEVPFLGVGFAIRRLVVSVFLPPLAGGAAAVMMPLWSG